MTNDYPNVGVCVLTHNAEQHLPHCLPPLIYSPLRPRVLVIDSSSRDRTVQVAQDLGAEVYSIDQQDFNHGATRELGRKKLGTDIVVMVTQDAYAKNTDTLTYLTLPLVQNQAVAAYARQLPHQNATLFESFHRSFNYPEFSEIRSLQDISRLGNQTFFFSNSFAAYRNTALDKVGGFQNVLFGEDTLAVAQLIREGFSIAYVAEAQVYHSHDYSLKQEFHRHFDIGYSRSQLPNGLISTARDQKRGKQYVASLFRLLTKKAPHLLPYGCLLVLSKWMGYQLGKLGHKTPRWWNRWLSSYKAYW